MTGERDLTDSDIEAILRRAQPEAWAALWSAVDALQAEHEHMTWAGGKQVDTTVVEGVERPVFQMPYAVYSPATERVVRALYDLEAIVPFNWPEWEGARMYREPSALDTAPVADAVRLLTAIVRRDRFAEGTIGASLADGTLLASLSRLRRWHDEESER